MTTGKLLIRVWRATWSADRVTLRAQLREAWDERSI